MSLFRTSDTGLTGPRERAGTHRPRVHRWLATTLALLPLMGLGADGPPEAPLLRLETAGHTTTIRRIASDRDGRWLVSASDDKTLRLWDATDGRLLRTYRPPIGDGNDGKLYAVAMDPAGEWIAAGGWTGYEWDRKHSLYILDRPSGQLRQRIPGHENVIVHLCVSPDGRRLAAVLGGGKGLRVYAADAGFTEVFADPDYGDHSYGCDFAADGRLVTSNYDGQLRLYAPRGDGLKRIATRAAEGGKRPHGVAFHPEGKRIAVGFADTTAVSIVDASDLRPLFRANTEGVDNGSLSSVAWSRDGRRLLAGGRYDDGSGNSPVLQWTQAGRGPRQAWPAADMTIMDLRALPDGRTAVGAADPALLVLDANGQPRWQQRAVIADMRNKLDDAFRIDAGARQVSFGLGYGAKDPVWFDLDERRLHRGAPPDATAAPGAAPWHPARTRAPGLDIEGWKNTTEPTLNGQPLKLKPYETSRALAIAPDARRFLLGTEWSLRLFDRDGEQLWRKPVPGVAWGVNISPDGRLAVAAFGDGTLRWYRLDDGEELLAFFPVNDPERPELEWVLWTPAGYYDASPGGDRLIGWHLNQGKDQVADFLPASQLRERFYRPEVVAAVLETLDEDQAIARAGIREKIDVADALPPTLRLLDPVDGALFTQPKLTLRYRASSREDAPITQLQVLVDGRPLAGARGLARVRPETASAGGNTGDNTRVGTLEVVLPKRDLELSLIAENRHGASPVASARLHWGGGGPAEFIAKPTLYLLAIGVSDYADDSLDLRFPAKDAEDLVEAFERQSGRLYTRVSHRLLANADADAILDGLDWLRREVTAKDIGMLYLAGHGVNDDDGDYYFLPTDVDTERLRRSAVPYYEIKKTLGALSGKTLAFIDTCHSGNIMGARRGVADINGVINDLSAAENGVVVFASSSGRQYSLEDPAWGNGAFTKALVEGLTGQADYTKDGTITINQLDLYLSERVKTLTDNRQTPTTTKPQTIADFPIATVE